MLFLVFPPPCFAVERQDLKAGDLKQNCAAAYAGTCQARIRCTTALRLGAPENGVIRNYKSSSRGLEAKILGPFPSLVVAEFRHTESGICMVHYMNLMCMGLGPSISSFIAKSLPYSGPA